jgi:hypothetical protein
MFDFRFQISDFFYKIIHHKSTIINHPRSLSSIHRIEKIRIIDSAANLQGWGIREGRLEYISITYRYIRFNHSLKYAPLSDGFPPKAGFLQYAKKLVALLRTSFRKLFVNFPIRKNRNGRFGSQFTGDLYWRNGYTEVGDFRNLSSMPP